jgi:O-antigen/teichoic acid export membrane protein
VGVVIKQSIRATIHVYVGVVIGFITAVVVFPRIFTPEQVGLLNILTQISLLISQFGIFGLPGIITYYFFHFQNKEKGHNGLPVIIAWGTIIGSVISILFLILGKSWIISKYPNPLFGEHYYQLITLTTFSIIYINLDSYYKGFYNVVLSTFLKETFQRLLLLVAAIFFFYKFCSFDGYVILYSLAAVIPVVWLFLAIVKDGHFPWKPDWDFVTPSLRTGMLTVGFYNILASISAYSNGVIDNIMISSMCGLPKGGIYTTTILFGMLVSIPSRTVRKITSALMAEAWKDDNHDKVYDIYQKSCITLYIIGFLIFLGVWTNVDNILQILPKPYSIGKWAIFWSCLTNLLEMTVGSAGSLLGTSKHYKVQTYQSILLVGFLVIANYIFIPIWGLTGAAFATTMSFLTYNSIRHFYIVYRWKMQPYGKEIVYVTIIGIATFGIIYFIPHFTYFMIDAVMRGILVVAFFGLSVYLLKISPEINTTVDGIIKKVPVLNKLIKIK